MVDDEAIAQMVKMFIITLVKNIIFYFSRQTRRVAVTGWKALRKPLNQLKTRILKFALCT
jgi:hypothetical protein